MKLLYISKNYLSKRHSDVMTSDRNIDVNNVKQKVFLKKITFPPRLFPLGAPPTITKK